MSVPALALEVDDDRRIDLRQYVDLPLVLMEGAHGSENVQILNIARRGFLVRTMRHYRTNDTVLLHFAGGNPCEARIVWCAKGMVGGRFVEGFDLDRLDQPVHPERSSPTAESRSNR